MYCNSCEHPHCLNHFSSWILVVSTLLLTETQLFAQATQAAQASGQPSLIESLVPILLVFVVMYFLLIRPQVKKAKEQANLINSLQVGDEVVTSGGIIGRIRSIS